MLRIFVEKKSDFNTEALTILTELKEYLGISPKGLRLFVRYDMNGGRNHSVLQKNLDVIVNTILSEPYVDEVYYENLPSTGESWLFVLDPPPGTDDFRSGVCSTAIQALCGCEKPDVRASRVWAFDGVGDGDKTRIADYLIKAYGGLEGVIEKPASLDIEFPRPSDVSIINGFRSCDEGALEEKISEYSLALTVDDMVCIRDYFNREKRDPSVTELRLLDTYWSDHCRHSTFNTIIENANITDPRVKEAYELFISVNKNRPVTLMNIATAAMRHLRANGKLPMLYDTGENNACTIRVNVDTGAKNEDWLLLFKNESHNHPTEVMPYDGAHTCLGGAIRDPLSGRAYVYQAMRITGAADPRTSLADTLPGKLRQKQITKIAAKGYSDYGNQVGLAAGYAKEVYHPGYVAKRMEVGALVGAVKLTETNFEEPQAGDIIIMIGARTGRDGIGAASSSSAADKTVAATKEFGVAVPVGDSVGGRKLGRLYRNPDFTALIKRCNDFGAGGVSVAVGELCDGLFINLDLVSTKYDGLSGTDLALSESQERMAIVISAKHEERVKELCRFEDLEAITIAKVTEAPRLIMHWRGKEIVNLSREFIDTGGAVKHTTAEISKCNASDDSQETAFGQRLNALLNDLSFCSQKGLVQHFDSSVGARTVFSPFGGSFALSEIQTMSALLPTKNANTASSMAYGFDPFVSNRDPFGGAVSAVISSVAKLVASGADLSTVHLSLQEFFPSPRSDSRRWGNCLASMLGAFWAQMGLEIAAIGGKDSCSGSYKDLDVPQTLISFAVAVSDARHLISPEFKQAGNPVYLLEAASNLSALKKQWEDFGGLVKSGKVLSAWACEQGGAFGGIVKMSLGNMIGFAGINDDKFFDLPTGSIVFEANEAVSGYKIIGYTQKKQELAFGEEIFVLEDVRKGWEAPLEEVFPTMVDDTSGAKNSPIVNNYSGESFSKVPKLSFAKPRVLVPVFSGTNGEYDTLAAVEKAGGIANLAIIRSGNILESVDEFKEALRQSQMLILPGGFAGKDEPDGSGKLIAAFLRNPSIAEAIEDLLTRRDGLILGICNGFQALVKLGLLPHGKITTMQESVTLATNSIGRFNSQYVHTRVSSVKSPWLALCEEGEIHTVPVAHGGGRFCASENDLGVMAEKGQIAFQYCDASGNPSMNTEHNPNGSIWAIEGITSPDGRILGKMAHSERYGNHVAKNIPGNKYQPIFAGGVQYFG